MDKYFIDTECVGFHGPIVLLQYAVNDGDVVLWEPWREKPINTIMLIEKIASGCVIAFNAAFDWFHICQMYTTLKLYVQEYPDDLLIDAERYAMLEPKARDLGCLKPAGACDVMLHIRKGPYQSTMDRRNIIIKKVPIALAPALAEWLNTNVQFSPLYFARRKEKGPIWKLSETKDVKFMNVYVSFAPSTALKPLIEDIFKINVINYSRIAPPTWAQPLELGYAPYALALQKLETWKKESKAKFKGKWKGAWPEFLEAHVRHWGWNAYARQYAGDDVRYTRMLFEKFGFETDDDDSVLAFMVGAIRWKGFRVDLDGIKELRHKALETQYTIGTDGRRYEIPTAPVAATRYIKEVMEPEEALVFPESTDKEALKEIISWGTKCSARAQQVFDARRARKEVETYDKLLIAERLHAAFKVLGTLSSRMAGDAQFNVQAVKRTKVVRSKFPLAWPGLQLNGGDFSAFEVTIMDAVYNDPELRAMLQSTRPCTYCHGEGCKKCDGTGIEKTKIHGVFGTCVFPHLTYEQILLSDGQVPDYYTVSKSGLFTWGYGGTEHSLFKRLGIPREQGRFGLEEFGRRFPRTQKYRQELMESFSPLYQEGGPGTAIEWKDPQETVETLLGFKRYFTLEYQVLKTLYGLANNLPAEWQALNLNVTRGDRVQTISGAVKSALFSACYVIQGQVARAAINTPIQGTGAQICKHVQRKIWDIQPDGYNDWVVMPLNVHDELMTPTKPEYTDQVEQVVESTVKELTSIVPLLEIEWNNDLNNWAEKKKKNVKG